MESPEKHRPFIDVHTHLTSPIKGEGVKFLHWEKLDVDFSVPGLVAGIFGTARWMAARAGRASSPAKAAAARANGAKGGRPRKAAS